MQVENEYGSFYKDKAYMPYLLQVSRLPSSGPGAHCPGPGAAVQRPCESARV